MARSLWPREHGAYFQMLAPLGAALIATGGSVAAAAFAAGACLAFVANEPLLVWLGHRGKRARQVDGARARTLLAVLAPLAIAAGVTGFVLASDAARVLAVVQVVPLALLLVLAWQKRERSLGGELVAAFALPGAAAPVAVAAGMAWQDAVLLWAAWAAGFGCTVIAVHRVIARHKRRASRADIVAGLVIAAALVSCAVLAFAVPQLATALPLAVVSLVLVFVPPPATRLRTVGYGLAGGTLVGIVLALFAG